ncbi:MAG: hypothetical protein N2111_11725 [Candidatus Sumerlaeaceae bacterium]|nr:hypothetical protein [Candidatus Sumerlaeaceae bacterium]
MKHVLGYVLAALVPFLVSAPLGAESASGYWRYAEYRLEPDPGTLGKGLPFKQISGALQVKPSANGSLSMTFMNEDADKAKYIAELTFGFTFDRSIETLVPGDKVPVKASLSFGGNDRAKALPSQASAQIAVGNGDYLVNLSDKKMGEPAWADGVIAVEGGGPGATMLLQVTAFIGSYGGFSGKMTIVYNWVEGVLPLPPSEAKPDGTAPSGASASSADPATPSGTQASRARPAPPAPRAPAVPTGTSDASSDLSGDWESQWGPVTFVPDTGQGKGNVYTGHWHQGDRGTGVIIEAKFDAITRILLMRYYQPWNKQSGTARLTLSADGSTLEGAWTQPSESGTWRMTREVPLEKVDERPSAVPADAAARPDSAPPQAAAGSGGGNALGNSSLEAIFAATKEEFDARYAGQRIRVTGILHQKQTYGNNPIVWVKVGNRKVRGAQVENGTPNAVETIEAFSPAWFEGNILWIEADEGVLVLKPGAKLGGL